VLEKVSYLSSVSGGGLPAAYYALHKPPRATPVLGQDGTMTEAYQTFFADLQSKVAQDFQNALIWRQISSLRFILNSALAARSLNEILEERLLGPGTLADLAVREKSGDSPRVLINGTLFNNGLRLGNYVQVREAIELELENIYNGKKTVNEGLNAAVLRGNAILREFSVSHGAAPQGEI